MALADAFPCVMAQLLDSALHRANECIMPNQNESDVSLSRIPSRALDSVARKSAACFRPISS
jgi:hypothetical protein